MKNLANAVKEKLASKYKVSDSSYNNHRSTDINVLLNRVKLDRKQEIRKKNNIIIYQFKICGNYVLSISFNCGKNSYYNYIIPHNFTNCGTM